MEHYTKQKEYNMSQNDEKILKLKEQIEEKKKSIKPKLFGEARTNYSLQWRGERLNLNAMDKDTLSLLACDIQALIYASDMIEARYGKPLTDTTVSGYPLSSWLYDILGKLEKVQMKEEESKLKQMEGLLNNLLSNDKKVELEIKKIEDLLS